MGRNARLTDLFTVGTHQIRNDDGTIGRPLEFTMETLEGELTERVHVVKLNEPDSQAVERRALAMKQRYLAAFKDPDSDERLAEQIWVDQVDDPEELIAFLVGEDMRSAAVEIEARLIGSEKWSQTYDISALMDAWYGDIEGTGELGLMWIWENPETSDDPVEQAENEARSREAARVWELIKEYNDDLGAALDEKKDLLVEDYYADEQVAVSIDALRARVVEVAGEAQAQTVFLLEKLRQVVFYCTRQVGDWRKRYFGTVMEVDDLPKAVRAKILAQHEELSVGAIQGKGSPGTPGSSPSSAPSTEAGPSLPSGHPDASPSSMSLASS